MAGLRGFGMIFAGLAVWTLFFYGPYSWSIFTWNYDNGQQPGFIYGLSFSMVVVIGNAIMYIICANVAEDIGYKSSDDREACYMVLYTVACTLNILLDLVTTYYMAFYIMSGLDF